MNDQETTTRTNGETKAADVVQTSIDALYESLALRGDVSMLKAIDKIAYYKMLCERLGLDPMTQPFLPLKLNGKEVFYATRAATDQLARLHNVTREVVSREQISDVYVVKVRASLPSQRFEESIGAVGIGSLKGEALANGLMKCETKAKRRATLALLGLGMLDETEIESIPARSMEHLNAIQIETTSAGAITAGGGDGSPAIVQGGSLAGDPSEEHMALQARLLQELQTLRDLGVSYTAAQEQMKLTVGKNRRDDLTNDDLEKVIATFADWSKAEAEKLRTRK